MLGPTDMGGRVSFLRLIALFGLVFVFLKHRSDLGPSARCPFTVSFFGEGSPKGSLYFPLKGGFKHHLFGNHER